MRKVGRPSVANHRPASAGCSIRVAVIIRPFAAKCQTIGSAQALKSARFNVIDELLGDLMAEGRRADSPLGFVLPGGETSPNNLTARNPWVVTIVTSGMNRPVMPLVRVVPGMIEMPIATRRQDW
jgi:hypothetical protein